MKSTLLGLTLAALAGPALADVTLYGRDNFNGRSMTTQEPVGDLDAANFGGRASSLVVRDGAYEFCSERGFQGKCVVLGPGRYPSLELMGLNDAIQSVRPRMAAAPQGNAEITLYSREGFVGRSFASRDGVRDLERVDFNDRASSAIVQGGRFEICEGAGFQGRCTVLRPGQYPSLSAMGLGRAVSSIRPVDNQARFEERRFAPPPPVAYDYRRRREERLFEAEVVAVRAVYGRPEQRCWVERESVRGTDVNAGAAIAGAIIGGILGHQVGSGRGNDAATAVGAVAGAALGSNYGGTTYGTSDVRRCAQTQVSGPPQYWDVTYRFNGMDRYVQMTRPPGPTITVNREGEPRAD